jgi:hypothetical protein
MNWKTLVGFVGIALACTGLSFAAAAGADDCAHDCGKAFNECVHSGKDRKDCHADYDKCKDACQSKKQ